MIHDVQLEIIPIGDLRPGSIACGAVDLKSMYPWNSSAIEIQWNADLKQFHVEFKANGKIDIPMEQALSKEIPLEIARSSACECGSSLELGNYTVKLENDDFTFRALYFCPSCKFESQAETQGISAVIKSWFYNLKKIEIKATGFGLERS